MKLLLIATLIFLTSCAGAYRVSSIDGYCVPESIYSAWSWTVRTTQPVRIAISNISKGIDHAQAQAYTGENWIYLTSMNGKVHPWKSHFDTVPYRYLTLINFIKEQRGGGLCGK